MKKKKKKTKNNFKLLCMVKCKSFFMCFHYNQRINLIFIGIFTITFLLLICPHLNIIPTTSNTKKTNTIIIKPPFNLYLFNTPYPFLFTLSPPISSTFTFSSF
eukprot:1007993_1